MAGKGTGTSGTTGNAPGPAGPVGLSLVQGRALLTVGQRDLGPALLQEAQVEFPGLKSLPNGGGAAGVRRRRGRLRIASLLVDNASLERRVAETPDKQTGITKLGVALEKGRIVLSGHVATSERSADFKARVTLAAGTGRSLRIGIEDLRVHGAPPLPLSAIANAALCALRGQPVDTHDGSQPGNAAFELDVLELALDEVFVAEGFRLPDTAGARLGSVAVTPKGVELVWSDRRDSARKAAGGTGAAKRERRGRRAPEGPGRREPERATRRAGAAAGGGLRAGGRRGGGRRGAEDLHRKRTGGSPGRPRLAAAGRASRAGRGSPRRRPGADRVGRRSPHGRERTRSGPRRWWRPPRSCASA